MTCAADAGARHPSAGTYWMTTMGHSLQNSAAIASQVGSFSVLCVQKYLVQYAHHSCCVKIGARLSCCVVVIVVTLAALSLAALFDATDCDEDSAVAIGAAEAAPAAAMVRTAILDFKMLFMMISNLKAGLRLRWPAH